MQVEKIEYEIDWPKFRRGTSIFIPCLDTTAARSEIAPVLKRLGIKVATKVVVVEGIRGLRMWRI